MALVSPTTGVDHHDGVRKRQTNQNGNIEVVDAGFERSAHSRGYIDSDRHSG